MRPLLVPAAAACLLSLSACGFQPMYAGPGYAQLPGLELTTGQSRVDYLLEQSLQRHFGQGSSPYRLSVQSETRESGMGLSASGIASRFSLQITSNYELTGGPGEPVRGRVREQVQFDSPNDPYALISARADAEERLTALAATRLAEEVAIAIRRREAGHGS